MSKPNVYDFSPKPWMKAMHTDTVKEILAQTPAGKEDVNLIKDKP